MHDQYRRMPWGGEGGRSVRQRKNYLNILKVAQRLQNPSNLAQDMKFVTNILQQIWPNIMTNFKEINYDYLEDERIVLVIKY